MKAKIQIVVVVLLLLGTAGSPAQAGSGHYTSGVEGIKVATLPPEGFYWALYNVFYNATEMKDKHGKTTPYDFTANAYVLVNRFIYSSPLKLLGANVVSDVCIPLQYTHLSTQDAGLFSFSDSSFGLGDIFIEPVILAWHGARHDASLAFGFYPPTGRFKADDPASLGKGFWTMMPSAGFTLYLDQARTWSASLLARYEVHTEQQDTDWTAGNDFHFEWGLGKTVNKIWDVGLAGYCSWQVTDDWGKDAVSDREQAYAIGPEVGVFLQDWGVGITLRSLVEFENRVGSQGNITTLRIMKAF